MTARATHPISSMDEARLSKLLAERAGHLAKAADCDLRAKALSKAWGIANGYKSTISPEQMKRELEYRARHGEEG